jgi:hypothetical protein
LGSADLDSSPFFLFCGSVGDGALDGKTTGDDINGILAMGGEDGKSTNGRTGEVTPLNKDPLQDFVGVSTSSSEGVAFPVYCYERSIPGLMSSSL